MLGAGAATGHLKSTKKLSNVARGRVF